MGDEIKRAVVKDDALHLVRGADVWSVKSEEGKEPNEWKIVHFANVGTSEEFIETFSGEILELVDGSLIFGDERESVKNAIVTIVVEGLMPAFEHLKKIRASVTTPLPELNRRQLYEDFARGLWHAYKDLFPKATMLLGFDIGFLFKQDAQFENALTAFLSKHPSLILDVPELLRRQRANWQQGLSSFRNDYLEHRKKDIAEFAAYYEPKTVEMLFDHAWRTMAELFPAFIEARYPPTLSIMEIPMNERDPKHLRRWRFFQCEPVERGNFTK
ncbi:hypothetical protein P8936_18045 [Edaphobacter paludis]|uniref:Uncharacterized protein n=1 Tax=Edaphobacter paludis TaxID=3035702 RepID=A0AAU7D8L0_9BACT